MSLHQHSQFTFLRATPTPEEIVQRAHAAGWSFAVLADENLHGAFRFWRACRRLGLKAVFGRCLRDGRVVYARNKQQFLRLCHDAANVDDDVMMLESEGAHMLFPADAERCRILQCIGSGEDLDASLLTYPLRDDLCWSAEVRDTAKMETDTFEDYSLEVSDTLPAVALHVEPYETEPYKSRLNEELRVVHALGFASYFAILADLMRWARAHDIPTGPGRGSAAGSLLAYRLGITRIDPLRHGLLFERFLNAERVAPPDIDVDFAPAYRGAIIEYLRHTYGLDHVVQVVAFSRLHGRSAFRDCARICGVDRREINAITALMPETKRGVAVTMRDAVTPELAALAADDHRVEAALRAATLIDGTVRHASVHAGGVVICNRPVREYVPVAEIDGVVVTQWDKDDLEAAGLVKFDLLGVQVLDVVEQTAVTSGVEPDMERLDDPAVWELCASGKTQYIFQLGGSGMRQFLRRLKPETFQELADAIALFRPGPLDAGMADAYVARHADAMLAAFECVRETRGVVVYQEQVMQIAREAAGFTLAQADLLRRAMGKKKPAEMQRMRQAFVAGGGDAELFDRLAFFAGYGFNKAHAVAYALLSYQTAWYKAHYPVDYMCAVMNNKKGKDLEYARAHAQRLGIRFLPPDVCVSGISFLVEDRCGERCIRTGLCGLPYIQHTTASIIVNARGDKPFACWGDYCERVPRRGRNKQVLVSLAQAGALFGLKPGEVV